MVLYDPPHLQNFRLMMKTWLAANSPEDMHQTLSTCLETPFVKIARFSKWICFIDQEKFAIYDSRVSLALRQIQVKGRRFFPTLGTKSLGRPKADYIAANANSSAKKMSEIYLTYTELLQTVRSNYDLPSVASIEMALFMLGLDKRYW